VSLELTLHEVALAFGRTPRGLRIATWHVSAGAHVAVCGPSGSGKTTLLDALAGLRRADEGGIVWGSLDISKLAQFELDRWRRDNMGLVFQQFELFPGLSALENVILPFRFTAWSLPSGARESALDLLERAGVPPTRLVACLSRGEMQRVAIVRALVRRPVIVLADEPTASLDRATGTEVTALMRALCREVSATLIVATHDRALANSLDHVYEIEDGMLAPAVQEEAA